MSVLTLALIKLFNACLQPFCLLLCSSFTSVTHYSSIFSFFLPFSPHVPASLLLNSFPFVSSSFIISLLKWANEKIIFLKKHSAFILMSFHDLIHCFKSCFDQQKDCTGRVWFIPLITGQMAQFDGLHVGVSNSLQRGRSVYYVLLSYMVKPAHTFTQTVTCRFMFAVCRTLLPVNVQQYYKLVGLMVNVHCKIQQRNETLQQDCSFSYSLT